MLEIEPATEVNKKWTVIWMPENNNQSNYQDYQSYFNQTANFFA
jgi:hypothetical protein